MNPIAKRRVTYGVKVFVVACSFWLTETWAFGWNAKPASKAEQLCDGIVVGLCVLSWFQIIIAQLVSDIAKLLEAMRK
jgi:hypothetical protein